MKNLICPYCKDNIEITWKRYWASASNKYSCPKCKKESKFRTNPRWVQYISWVIQLLPFVSLGLLFNQGSCAWLVLLTLIPIMYLDKHLDEKYGILVEHTKPRAESNID